MSSEREREKETTRKRERESETSEPKRNEGFFNRVCTVSSHRQVMEMIFD